jgi:hypothetical protein
MSVTKQVVHTIAFFVLGWNLLLTDLLACEHVLFEDTFHVLNPSLKLGVMTLQKIVKFLRPKDGRARFTNHTSPYIDYPLKILLILFNQNRKPSVPQRTTSANARKTNEILIF